MSKLTCKDKPCKNAGTCTYEKMHDVITYRCTCPPEYTGGQCHVPTGACASNPCQNGAVCTKSGPTYKCNCLPGFEGRNCEINRDSCASYPCFNGARCINLYNDYKCECPSSSAGKRCGFGQFCKNFHCANAGTCEEKQEGASCKCAPGFTGVQCEKDVNECLDASVCGDNVCVNTVGSHICMCPDGSLDNSCHKKKDVKEKVGEKGLPILLMVACGSGGLVLLILVIVVIVCCRRRASSRSYQHPADHPTEMKNYPFDCYHYPPNPPPRHGLGPGIPPAYSPVYTDDLDEASAAMYDPSLVSMVTFSGASSPEELKKPQAISPARTSIPYDSDDDEVETKSLPGYHWDYSEVPENVMKRSRENRQSSREGSRIGLTRTDQFYEDDEDDYNNSMPRMHTFIPGMPQVPERPHSRRSSIKDGSEYETDVPELPQKPMSVRLSRQSLPRESSSPINEIPELTNEEFHNRYSIMSDDVDEDRYLHDAVSVDYPESDTCASELDAIHERYANNGGAIRRIPPLHSHALYGAGHSDLISEDDDVDGYTETSFNSDDDYATEADPLDPENTRKMERDIKKLIKDCQKLTDDASL